MTAASITTRDLQVKRAFQDLVPGRPSLAKRYSAQLEAATTFLASRSMRVWIYNHQLCAVPKELWPFCRQSISDWKNEFLADCADCAVRTDCGGFFASAIARRKTSRLVSPVKIPC